MGEGGGHAAGGAGFIEGDDPSACGHSELCVGCVSGGVGCQIGGYREDGEGCECEDRCADAFTSGGAEGGGAFEWDGLCLVHGFGGFKWV